MSRFLVLLTLVLALAMAGCGGGADDDDGGADTAPSGGASGAGGPEEVEATIKGFLTEGGCERMTDKFLEEQTLGVGGDTRQEQCDYFEETFQKPQYTADDIVVSEVEIEGDRATATVGDNISNVDSTYNLVAEEGQWRLDSVDL